MTLDGILAPGGVALALLAAHVLLGAVLVWASRRAWTGYTAVFVGLFFQLPLLVLELGSVTLAGAAVLEHGGRPLLTLALAPLAVLAWWLVRQRNEPAGLVNIPLPPLPSLAALRGVRILFSGLAVLVAIAAVTLAVLWCLVLSQALFGAAPLTLAATWTIVVDTFVTAAPAFAAAAAISVLGAIVIAAITAARSGDA